MTTVAQLSPSEVWFVTGSQHLYGPDTLRQVAANSKQMAQALSESLPVQIVFKPVMTDPGAIRDLCLEANRDPKCAGLILWMHTFSPAKMWIGGLTQLRKPILHLHSQFNLELPWNEIDMDFMNLNQAAHGDREAGHLHARLRLHRKVVAGHWSDKLVQREIEQWARVARGWSDLQGARFGRFGDNMREVSVTEGDKVAAEARFGFSVNTYGVGDLVEVINSVSDAEVKQTIDIYQESYEVIGNPEAIAVAARQEVGIRKFLSERDLKGFTTTFEDLHGLRQLPGLACQRLMAEGYGFGAEGDWKTAALLRFAKVAADGLSGGTSFMEDYTYHLDPKDPLVLGAHMLEICPSIAGQKPRLEVHPLGIGGKEDPARLVFDAQVGPAVNASLVDMGNRFRLIVNEVEAVPCPQLPKLPVARALWRCRPDFKTAVSAWIHAGGAHHTVYSNALGSQHFMDFAEMAGIECLVIDDQTELEGFRNQLRWNEAYYHFTNGPVGY